MKHKVKHIHFVGIGGVGMSGIAEVLATLGYQVSGSDQQQNSTIERLRRLGITCYRGHVAEHIKTADVVVISSAVGYDNPEVAAARTAHIPVIPRAQMLAELMRLKKGIAIAGTHGKTTTTSLTASILAEAGLDPTFVIGGRLTAAGSNARLGSGDFLIAEADESDASFLCLTPVLSVVTNIDFDHMETYGHDPERLYQAFVDFIHRLPFYGAAVLCLDDPAVQRIVAKLSRPIIGYGLTANEASIRAENIVCTAGVMHFEARVDNERWPIVLPLPGLHNVQNALAAIGVAYELQIEPTAVIRALAEFKGVGRRFQRYGRHPLPTGGSIEIVDDYGHHPVEMAATLAAARLAFPGRRLLLAFQPHRYSRTRDCFEDFVNVLSEPDVLVLSDVYAAGEAPIVAADSRALARAIRVAARVEPHFVADVADLPAALATIANDGDVVLCMGAGSIGHVAANLVGHLSAATAEVSS